MPWAFRSPGWKNAGRSSGAQCCLLCGFRICRRPRADASGMQTAPVSDGCAGVERDLSKAHSPAVFTMRYSSTASCTPSARAAHRENPAFPAVLEQPVPQDAFGGQLFVRPACNDGAVSLDERRHFRCAGGRLGPAILFGINLLALCHLSAEGGGSLRGLLAKTIRPDTPVSSRWMTPT